MLQIRSAVQVALPRGRAVFCADHASNWTVARLRNCLLHCFHNGVLKGIWKFSTDVLDVSFRKSEGAPSFVVLTCDGRIWSLSTQLLGKDKPAKDNKRKRDAECKGASDVQAHHTLAQDLAVASVPSNQDGIAHRTPKPSQVLHSLTGAATRLLCTNAGILVTHSIGRMTFLVLDQKQAEVKSHFFFPSGLVFVTPSCSCVVSPCDSKRSSRASGVDDETLDAPLFAFMFGSATRLIDSPLVVFGSSDGCIRFRCISATEGELGEYAPATEPVEQECASLLQQTPEPVVFLSPLSTQMFVSLGCLGLLVVWYVDPSGSVHNWRERVYQNGIRSASVLSDSKLLVMLSSGSVSVLNIAPPTDSSKEWAVSVDSLPLQKSQSCAARSRLTTKAAATGCGLTVYTKRGMLLEYNYMSDGADQIDSSSQERSLRLHVSQNRIKENIKSLTRVSVKEEDLQDTINTNIKWMQSNADALSVYHVIRANPKAVHCVLSLSASEEENTILRARVTNSSGVELGYQWSLTLVVRQRVEGRALSLTSVNIPFGMLYNTTTWSGSTIVSLRSVESVEVSVLLCFTLPRTPNPDTPGNHDGTPSPCRVIGAPLCRATFDILDVLLPGTTRSSMTGASVAPARGLTVWSDDHAAMHHCGSRHREENKLSGGFVESGSAGPSHKSMKLVIPREVATSGGLSNLLSGLSRGVLKSNAFLSGALLPYGGVSVRIEPHPLETEVRVLADHPAVLVAVHSALLSRGHKINVSPERAVQYFSHFHGRVQASQNAIESLEKSFQHLLHLRAQLDTSSCGSLTFLHGLSHHLVRDVWRTVLQLRESQAGLVPSIQ